MKVPMHRHRSSCSLRIVFSPCLSCPPASSSKLPGRVDYLPVEWHTKFRDRAGEGEAGNDSGHLRLRDITLSRIPHLRSFVNDALLDVLYFMSPAYHQVVALPFAFHN